METPSVGKNGLIIFDGSCGACSVFVGEHKEFFKRYGFTVAALQSAGIAQLTGRGREELMRSIHLYTPDGKIYSEDDFLINIGSRIWWTWAFAWIASLHPFRTVLRIAYRYIATRRRSISRICGLQSKAYFRE